MPEGVHLPLYMDNHATTPLDPRVLEAMMPYFTGKFGNAASRNHAFGWEAEAAVENAREQIAKLIGATAKEIIFTSGATESNNLAIKGVAEMYRERGNHIITQATEHKAVLDTCKKLEKHGLRRHLPARPGRRPHRHRGRSSAPSSPKAPTRPSSSASCTPTTRSASSSPSPRSASSATRRASSSTPTPSRPSARSRSTSQNDNIDLLSLSAHKIYGPKGVGALYVRRRNPRVQITEQINGGGHERGMRSGTLNVPGIVGLGKACEICAEGDGGRGQARVTELRDYLKAKLENALDYVHVNGNMEHHLPGNLNMSFVYVEGESLLMGINDIAVIAPARPAPRPPSNPATSSRPSASATTSPTAPSASASAASTPRPKSTTSPTRSST